MPSRRLTKSNNRAIAADSRATRIYIRATIADSQENRDHSREIATDIREIASEWWPCASTSQEMAVNIEEIGIYRPRNAAATVETAASSGILAANIKKPIIYEDSIQR